MPQPLTTVPERAQLLANGEARAAGQAIDPAPVVRLFTPDAHVTWLLAALDPADGDTAWGLIDLGIGMPAQGTVKLSELAGIVNSVGDGVSHVKPGDKVIAYLGNGAFATQAKAPAAAVV
ncbi:DUF2958 domain-containing protein, partial [Salmonella enterica subsp. enterica serovar Typhimurium]|nr:DUF2958 domain-containing protein [Salmonella enterica subsp. enterica serovar Typhimurium]